MLPLFKRQCNRIRPDLWDYIAERLPEGTLEQIERHLATCKACRNETEGLRRAQNLLLEARLEEPPAPKRGWGELQARLEREGGAVLAYAPPVLDQQPRPRAIARWTPNFAMVGSCIMLFCSAGLTYRALNLQQSLARAINTPATNTESFAASAAPNKTGVSSLPSNNPALIAAGAKTVSPKQTREVKPRQKFAPSPVRELYDDAIRLTPAGYSSNPEITDPAPKASMLRFSNRAPQDAERPKKAPAEKEYIMGTLTPAAREGDSAE